MDMYCLKDCQCIITGYTQNIQGSSSSDRVCPKPLHGPAGPSRICFCTSKFGQMLQPTQFPTEWVLEAVSVGVSQQKCEADSHKLLTARILECHPSLCLFYLHN